jgi:hypothetical protein
MLDAVVVMVKLFGQRVGCGYQCMALVGVMAS